jgi:hypothetical protein
MALRGALRQQLLRKTAQPQQPAASRSAPSGSAALKAQLNSCLYAGPSRTVRIPNSDPSTASQ